jgi:pilus assembly protein Flp/PilA
MGWSGSRLATPLVVDTKEESLMSHVRRTEEGASAVEYGLIVVAIAAVIAAVVFSLGTATGGLFSDSCEGLRDSVNSHGGGANC